MESPRHGNDPHGAPTPVRPATDGSRPDDDVEADELRAIREELGIPGIIDIHTHFMPDRVMAKVWHYFDHVVPRFGVQWPVTYKGPESERVERLGRFGVTAFTALVYPHKPDMAAWLNDWSLGFAARTPGCIPTATFFPEPDAADYVTNAIERGARLFKAHVQVGDYDPNDPLLDPVWEILETSRTPVLIHAGSGPAPGRFTGPAGVRSLLQRFPGLRLVIAHMGLPEYSDFMDLADEHADVWLDTTMAFTEFTERDHPFPHGELGRLVDLGDRILFGSDYPNIPYPYTTAVRAIVDLGLGEDWTRGVLHTNALALGAVSGLWPIG